MRMMKNVFVYFMGVLLLAIVSCCFSACGNGNGGISKPKKEGVVAIVYVDLTGSINEDTANRVQKNIGELFLKLPPESKFYLYSIDKGTSKPDIYNFVPTFTKVAIATDEDKRKEEIENNKVLRANIELPTLNKELNTYHTLISSQKGAVSCLTNKINSLLDFVRNKSDSYPNYELRVYFYSDMIEECENSFDGMPLDFKKKPNEIKEKEHLQEILNRIEKGFPLVQSRDLKSLGTKIHIVLTSQDDKQSYRQLKIIWGKIFEKFGYNAEDIDKKDYFYWGDGTDEILWHFEN
jgi:hypothetical protein